MSRTVIQVENLGKLYRLGEISTGMIAQDLKRWWAKKRGQEDPFLKIDSKNDRTRKTDDQFAWALKDVNFSIKEGDAVGIIGRNGAGKSTLLKLLSKVTSPSAGNIKIKGRIASLLEVGTGFHPELTGRENIFLNGAILGMTKREIASKLDEIIDFSGVQKYIDTPVKRYSSGMYVRLAFAVAAHLEPEILIIDEVLAVGDAEFQKKCLGKMKDVSGHGRTVLFVSHNMTAIQSLCNTSILLENGTMKVIGDTKDVMAEYFGDHGNATLLEWPLETAPGNESAKILKVELQNNGGTNISTSYLEEDVFIEITYQCLEEGARLNVSLAVMGDKDEHLFSSPSTTDNVWCGKPHPSGVYKSLCKLPANFFNDINYKIYPILVKDAKMIAQVENFIPLQKVDSGALRNHHYDKWFGLSRPILEWKTSKVS